MRKTDTVTEGRTVHALLYGRTFCGMPGVPIDWPNGHLWTDYRDLENINCVGCLAALADQH